MTLVRCDQISIEFGDTPLLVDADFSVETGERVCLIGRNGTGKSTLMKIVTGEYQPDRGEVQYKDNLRVSVLDQQLPESENEKVFDVVRQGLARQIRLIEEFKKLSDQSLNHNDLKDLEALQSRIEAGGGWQPDQQVETIISQLELPAESRMADLSGGWRRRVALARALVSNPELLLLDEPTNHLDISTIEWLEHVVRGFRGSVIFVTHDRTFLEKLATRIVEIDRGKLISWPGSYRHYLDLKEKANEEEDTRNALFDKRLEQEENWIRQGIKARRTRNEGRVRALHAMREERAKRIKRQGKAKIHISEAEESGRKVIEARSVRHAYGDNLLLDGFKIRLMRGDRIGLIGNNGVGKSTLLKILLGQLTPDEGTIKMGTNLVIGYFDQIRRELEWDKTVAENVGNGKEYIKVNGRDRHIVGYLKNFLFSPKRAMTPVRNLSGGECNRVLLAKLFTQPNNLLVLDEPTNDLDVEMLEVLEEKLVEFNGTLIVVSHDRDFLDNVVTSTLVFEGDGKVVEYAGGYSDWAARGKNLKIADTPAALKKNEQKAPEPTSDKSSGKPVKLSYKFQRELDMLPDEIERLEAQIAEIQKDIEQPSFYDQSFDKTQPVLDELARLQGKLDQATERWFELEEMKAG
jgi:ATP-binding cassette subfamily F protein uup